MPSYFFRPKNPKRTHCFGIVAIRLRHPRRRNRIGFAHGEAVLSFSFHEYQLRSFGEVEQAEVAFSPITFAGNSVPELVLSKKPRRTDVTLTHSLGTCCRVFPRPVCARVTTDTYVVINNNNHRHNHISVAPYGRNFSHRT